MDSTNSPTEHNSFPSLQILAATKVYMFDSDTFSLETLMNREHGVGYYEYLENYVRLVNLFFYALRHNLNQCKIHGGCLRDIIAGKVPRDYDVHVPCLDRIPIRSFISKLSHYGISHTKVKRPSYNGCITLKLYIETCPYVVINVDLCWGYNTSKYDFDVNMLQMEPKSMLSIKVKNGWPYISTDLYEHIQVKNPACDKNEIIRNIMRGQFIALDASGSPDARHYCQEIGEDKAFNIDDYEIALNFYECDLFFRLNFPRSCTCPFTCTCSRNCISECTNRNYSKLESRIKAMKLRGWTMMNMKCDNMWCLFSDSGNKLQYKTQILQSIVEKFLKLYKIEPNKINLEFSVNDSLYISYMKITKQIKAFKQHRWDQYSQKLQKIKDAHIQNSMIYVDFKQLRESNRIKFEKNKVRDLIRNERTRRKRKNR